MHNFKQFLDESELSELSQRLFFQREIHLSPAAAKAALQWYKTAGLMNAFSPTSIPEDGWDHILDWAEEFHVAGGGKSLYKLQQVTALPLLVKGVIAKVMREKYKINEASELKELSFVLAIRKMLGCSREQANEIILWLKGDKDFPDLDHDARDEIIAKWDPEFVNDHKHPGFAYEDYVMNEINSLLRTTYKLDARELV